MLGSNVSKKEFVTGNSGNLLFDAVVKLGPEAQQEGAYCQLLGDIVAPRVYALIPGGYVMERLKPCPRHVTILVEIYKLLERHVWSQPILTSSTEDDWKPHLQRFGIEVPDWALEGTPCMVHGDPTVSNALIREKKGAWEMGDIVMCDPRPPRNYMPQFMETDLGRILQSKLGWEVAAYDAIPVEFVEPPMDKMTRLRAMFWCGAAAARIEYLERSRGKPRMRVIDWCKQTRYICGV